MTYKKWLFTLFALLTLILVPVVSVMCYTYYIDPYWNFTHDHDNNDYQYAFDERLLKLNYLDARKPAYEGLLVGTSRVTYMNSESFQNQQVYNLGLSSLHIDEYSDYIRIANEITASTPTDIYFELSLHSYYGPSFPVLDVPDAYYKKATSRVEDIVSLFSMDTYERAKQNHQYSKDNYYEKHRSYSRSNQVTTIYPNINSEYAVKRFIRSLDKIEGNAEFPYDEDYKERLEEISQQVPGASYLPFSDLVPFERLQAYLSIPMYWDAYERYIVEITDTYDVFYSFHTKSEYTTNYTYWFDAYHFYPEVGDVMIRALETGEGEGVVYNKITKENREEYLKELKRSIK